MVFQQGSTSVHHGSVNDLGQEIAHLSSICAQPCVFTGPDAEAGALTYAAVRVLLLRATEQQEHMARLYESLQTLSQETRASISSCMEELASMRSHVATLQQNMQEVYSTLQNHGSRLNQLDSISSNLSNIDSVLTAFEQRIQVNTNSIGQLDRQQQEITAHVRNLCSVDVIDRRVRELGDVFGQRLQAVEHSVREVQNQKADAHQVQTLVSNQVQTAVNPLEMDVSALYRLWDLNKADVHSCAHATSGMSVQHRVQVLHSTPAFLSLLEMLRTPALPTVTVGPASMSGSSNINVISSSHTECYTNQVLSPRTSVVAQQQSSYLGIEVGPASGNTGGVIVTRVIPGTPASAAGICVGDVLVAMNDQSFSSVTDLVAVTRQCLASKPRDGCYLSVTRLTNHGQEKLNMWIP